MNTINRSIVVLSALLAVLVCPVPVQARQTVELSMTPLFQLNPTDPADLVMQSRRFDAGESDVVLNGCLSVLQDMGYSITSGDRQLGLVTAKKRAEVLPPGLDHAVAEAVLVATTVLLSLLTGQDMVTDLPEQIEQTIFVSLLVSVEDESQTLVRLSIDRDMRYDNGFIIPDHTELPLIYQEFFEKLSRAVFLEAHQL
jgi:hypothetical protein